MFLEIGFGIGDIIGDYLAIYLEIIWRLFGDYLEIFVRFRVTVVKTPMAPGRCRASGRAGSRRVAQVGPEIPGLPRPGTAQGNLCGLGGRRPAYQARPAGQWAGRLDGRQ